jgi:hypothetical protein
MFVVRQDTPSVVWCVGQAVSCQLPSLNKALVQLRPVLVGSFVDKVYLHGLCRVFLFSFLSVISSMFHTRIGLHASNTRRRKVRIKKVTRSKLLSASSALDRKVYSIASFADDLKRILKYFIWNWWSKHRISKTFVSTHSLSNLY